MHMSYVSGGYKRLCVILNVSLNKKKSGSLRTVIGRISEISKGQAVPRQQFAFIARHDGDGWLLS